MSDNNTNTISDIDAALAAAKAAKGTESTESAPSSTLEVSAKPKMTDEEKAAAKAAKDAEREAKKAERAAAREAKLAEYRAGVEQRKAERAAKKAERESARAARVPHLAKVQKAAENLPELSDAAEEVLSSLEGLSAANISCILAHADHHLRESQTKASIGVVLEVGQLVKITSGPAQYLGQTGTVSKVQRIRCLVDVPGFNKPAYLFLADVEVVEADGESLEEDNGEETAEAVAS